MYVTNSRGAKLSRKSLHEEVMTKRTQFYPQSTLGWGEQILELLRSERGLTSWGDWLGRKEKRFLVWET